MALSSLSRRAIQRMRLIGVAILLIGIASFGFGIALLVSADTVHDEEVEQLEMELSPTSINELKDLREELRDYRHLVAKPEDTEKFITDYINIDGLLWNEENTNMDDFKWEAWNNLLLQEKGTSVALITLGTAEMVRYAGAGTIILSVGLIIVGLLVIILSPSINQMRKSLVEINNTK